MLTKLYFYSSILFAGPGEGHSHGPALHGEQWIGLAIIIVLAGGVFWFLSKKK